jgi:hypothetical protein
MRGHTEPRWEGLTRFLHDGRIELDTNPVERAIRPVKTSRTQAYAELLRLKPVPGQNGGAAHQEKSAGFHPVR